MIWGYQVGAGGKPPTPIKLEIADYCHALITGASGSGKSYALIYLEGSLLQSNPNTDIYFCDFKNSTDFAFMKRYSHYYAGDDCYDGVMDYYESFCKSRRSGRNLRRRHLIFDEYPAFINYLSTKDKVEKTKKANDILSVIAEVLMLGRGIQYGVWIVTQRADASLFANGARDNFMVVVGLGRMSKEQKGMIFTGEEIPEKVFQRGEGMLLADGHEIKEVKYPKINGMYDWKNHIMAILQKYETIDPGQDTPEA